MRELIKVDIKFLASDMVDTFKTKGYEVTEDDIKRLMIEYSDRIIHDLELSLVDIFEGILVDEGWE